MTTILRPYQRAAVDSVREYWQGGGGNPLVEMATGTGKSIVIGTLAQEVLTEYPDMRVLMLVHVRELVEQNALALLRLWPQAPLGINSAGLNRRDRHSRILFASIQSVYKSGYNLGPRDLVLIDEAHLCPKTGEGMYRTLLEALREMVPDLRVAGFTATGFRLDTGRLDDGDDRLFHDVVYTYNLGDGVRDGWLAPLWAPAHTTIEIDVRGVARRGGEFVAGALEAAADKVDVVQGAADEMLRLGADRKSWLAFCSGVDHAAHVRDALRERGISAETVTGETPNGERDRIIRGFRAGQIRCLTNAMVLTTGFDVPRVDLISMLRPTLSTGLYVQTLGRGTRLSEGKSDCLVLDFAGNVRRHGPVDAVSVKQSVGQTKAERDEAAVKPDSVRAKICPACHTYNALDVFVCVHCGHEWPLPAPKHAAQADVLPVMTRDLPKWIPICDVLLEKHQKMDSPDSLRVEYVAGIQTFREWICLEHSHTARWKAEAWWKSMGGLTPAPEKIDDALNRAQELDLATAVTVVKDGKYWRIVSRRVRRPNGALIEIDDRFRCKLVDETQEVAA